MLTTVLVLIASGLMLGCNSTVEPQAAPGSMRIDAQCEDANSVASDEIMQGEPRTDLRPLGRCFTVDKNSIIWCQGRAVGYWGVDGGEGGMSGAGSFSGDGLVR